MLNVLDHVMMRTLGNIYIESSQRKIGLQVSGFGLYEAVCMCKRNSNEPGYDERTLTESV
jgi:hypothetical protein